MNDTTPPSAAPGPAPGGSSDRFFSWLRGLGIVRGGDRWFAGVAGGIAAKAGIDPLIVRGVFVVLAVLGGPGILLYLAGWLLLPDRAGRIHLEELLRGRASAGAIATAVVLGAILVIPLVIWMFRAIFGGPWAWGMWGLPDWMQVVLGVLWWAVLLPAAIVWLIVWFSRGAGRGSRGPGAPMPGAPEPGSGQAPTARAAQASSEARGSASPQTGSPHVGVAGPDSRPFSQRAEEFGQQAGQKADAWGREFGEKAEQWGRKVDEKSREWEQRGREYHEAHRLGAVHIVLTLALALLAGGTAAAWALTLGAGGDLVLTAGLVATVSVLAVSTIIAGVRGRDSGWVGFLSFCGVIALIFAPFSTVLPEQTDFVPFGDSGLRPSDTGHDRAIVSIGGNATVDLSDIGYGAEARTIDVWLLGGNTTVRLPESVPTRVQVNLLAGNVRDQRLSVDERRQGGILMSRTITQPATGPDESETITVRVRMLGGNVSVEGASGSGSSSQQSDDRADEIERLKQQIEELEDAR